MTYKNKTLNWGRFYFVSGNRLSDIVRIFFLADWKTQVCWGNCVMQLV